jgi:cytochrome P450
LENVVERLSFADPAVARCPFEAYDRLRLEHPVYRDPKIGLFEVLGAAEIRQAAADTETFTCLTSRQFGMDSDLRAEMARIYTDEGFPPMPTLLNNDGEDHKRLRSLVDRAFTAPRINALMPAIRGEVDRLLEALTGREEIEFISEFAIPLPLNIIADQLGVSRNDHHAFKAGSDAMLAVVDPLTPRDEVLDHVRAIVRMQQLIAECVESVREDPDETMLGVVATSEAELLHWISWSISARREEESAVAFLEAALAYYAGLGVTVTRS